MSMIGSKHTFENNLDIAISVNGGTPAWQLSGTGCHDTRSDRQYVFEAEHFQQPQDLYELPIMS